MTAGEGRWYLADAPAVAWWLWLGATLASIAATAAVCLPVGRQPAPPRCLRLEFALVTSVVNLITPFCFYHQFVWMLIPFFVLAEEALRVPARRWMLVPLAIGYVLTDVHGLLWRRLEFNPFLVSTPLFTALALWGLLAWLILREKHRCTEQIS